MINNSDDQQFQSAEKEVSLQVINYVPNNLYHNQVKRDFKKTEELTWKFEIINQKDSTVKPKNKIQTLRNISFKEDKCLSYDGGESSDDDEDQRSSLDSYYKHQKQIYKKQRSFGTSWIGRKQYFSSTFIDTNKIAKQELQYYSQQTPLNEEVIAEKVCVFDADFESGNLHCAYQVGSYEYDLILQNDINTKGNTQWFYFRIINPPKKQNIKINIVNLRKSDSLFNYGMMPCILSQQAQKKSKIGWVRRATNVSYFKNDHQIENSRRFYYTLTFTIQTNYDNDVLRVAQCYPYTYTNLNSYLQNIEKVKYKNDMTERQTIINTIGKNKVEVITIKQNTVKAKNNRPLIIVLARQHPGETPGSFVCEGLMDFLYLKDKDSEYLRRNYQIKIIPMVNPDGVCAGNYRTNLNGFDLNRRWDGAKNKIIHEAAYIKKYLAQFTKGRQIAFIIDLHGHSRKMFSFFYGNPNQLNPAEVRVFPYLCSKLAPNCIRFEDSTFTCEEYKRTTARVQFHLSFKTSNIFTFETSFYGYINKQKQKKHFTIEGYKQLGYVLGKAIYIHQRGKQLFELNQEAKDAYLYKKCLNELRGNHSLLVLGEKQNSGSESSPEECEIKQNEQKKLEQDDQYNKDLKNQKQVKIVKKIVRKDLPVKQSNKSSRQMQLLDIAQVNSVFPNNVIALIPSSFLAKRKKITLNVSTQTENSPLVKIYEACKQQQLKNYNNPEGFTEDTLSSKNSSNLFRSNILNRPKSSAIEISQNLEGAMGFTASQRRSRQIKKKMTDDVRFKSSTVPKNNRFYNKATQTTLSFSSPHYKPLKIISFQKQKQILGYKSFGSNFSTIQYPKSHMESRGIGKTIVKNLIENVKLRKKSIY